MHENPKIRIIVEGAVHTGKSMTAQIIKRALSTAYPDAKLIHEDQDGEVAGARAQQRLEEGALEIAATTFEIIEQTAVDPTPIKLRDVSVPKAGPYQCDG